MNEIVWRQVKQNSAKKGFTGSFLSTHLQEDFERRNRLKKRLCWWPWAINVISVTCCWVLGENPFSILPLTFFTLSSDIICQESSEWVNLWRPVIPLICLMWCVVSLRFCSLRNTTPDSLKLIGASRFGEINNFYTSIIMANDQWNRLNVKKKDKTRLSKTL